MWRFILLTFAFLGWAFYEMSGGAEFEPVEKAEIAPEPKVETVALAAAPTPKAPEPKTVEPKFEVTLASLKQPEPKPTPAGKPRVDVEKVRAVAAPGTSMWEKTSADPSAEDLAKLTKELEIQKDVRQVTGNRVNMRQGPGKKYNVVARLTRGQEVEILQDPGNGWVKLKVIETNRIGWMAEFLLTASNG